MHIRAGSFMFYNHRGLAIPYMPFGKYTFFVLPKLDRIGINNIQELTLEEGISIRIQRKMAKKPVLANKKRRSDVEKLDSHYNELVFLEEYKNYEEPEKGHETNAERVPLLLKPFIEFLSKSHYRNNS